MPSLVSSGGHVLVPSFPVASEEPIPTPRPGQRHLPIANTQFCSALIFFFNFFAGDNNVFLAVLQHNCKFSKYTA